MINCDLFLIYKTPVFFYSEFLLLYEVIRDTPTYAAHRTVENIVAGRMRGAGDRADQCRTSVARATDFDECLCVAFRNKTTSGGSASFIAKSAARTHWAAPNTLMRP